MRNATLPNSERGPTKIKFVGDDIVGAFVARLLESALMDHLIQLFVGVPLGCGRRRI